MGKQVIVSLTSGKVYVGVLLQASGDPNETERSIVIQPVMSGFRDDNHLVTFNTDYFIANNLPDIRLLLPMRNVQSLANFDGSIHTAFIARGVTKVIPAQQVASSPPQSSPPPSESEPLEGRPSTEGR